MRDVCTLPYAYGVTTEKKSVSLEADGLACVPVLESNRFAKSKPFVNEHRHPGCIEFVYCCRGNPVFACAGRRVPLMPGQILAIQPEVSHHLLTNQQGVATYGMFFRVDTPRPLLRLPRAESDELKRRLAGLPRAPFAAGPETVAVFRHLFEILETQERGTFRTLSLRAAVLRLVLQIVSASGREPLAVSKRARIEGLVAEIRARPEADFTLDELARRACVSPSLLLSLFKERTGLPPHAFLTSCRLETALRLLRTTDLPVAEIAARCSFATPQHFANVFKRRYGITAVAARHGAAPIV